MGQQEQQDAQSQAGPDTTDRVLCGEEHCQEEPLVDLKLNPTIFVRAVDKKSSDFKYIKDVLPKLSETNQSRCLRRNSDKEDTGVQKIIQKKEGKAALSQWLMASWAITRQLRQNELQVSLLSSYPSCSSS